MTRIATISLAGLLCIAAPAGVAAPQPTFDVGQAAHDAHIEKATAGTSGAQRAAILGLCAAPTPDWPRTPAGTPPPDVPEARVPPAGVFDQLYFIGDKDASVWALKTSIGFVLFDASFNTRVQSNVEQGLKTLGFDPKDIKYVFVTHAHDDHYGGAKYLQDTYHPHIVMGALDWLKKMDPDHKGARVAFPTRDIAAGDQVMKIGDTAIRIVSTPGHTPGTLSFLFPVTDHGERHVVSLWGGGYPNEGGTPAMKTYVGSILKYQPLAAKAGADVAISNHPKNDESLSKMRTLAERKDGQPNPFVLGRAMVAQRYTVIEECSRAYIAAHSE